MSEKDLRINAKVRRILVENNLDLSVLTVSTASGAVTIRGEVKKLFSREIGDNKFIMLLILLETSIMKVSGVKRVLFYVDNWKRVRGKWIKIKEEQ